MKTKNIPAKILPAAVVTLCMATLAGGIWADDLALEEVIVTAEKRSDNLQEVPLSVTVFSGDLVNDAGITDLEDIAIRTPNLSLSTFNIGEPQLFLRGIGNTSDSIGADPAVAVFIDDVYVGRPGATSFDLYDLDRIEVLRGPQGTLYGKNVAGGAINVFTKKPSDEFAAKAGATIGDEGLRGFRGYLNGAISDNVFGKLTFSKRDRDGFADNNLTGQELDDLDNLSVRSQVLLQSSDSTEILLSADYSKDETNGKCRHTTSLAPGLQPASVPASRLQRTIDELNAAGVDRRTCGFDTLQGSNKSIFGASVRIEVDLGWASFLSLTAFRRSDLDWIQSLGPLPQESLRISVLDFAEEEARQVSQELRLSGTNGNIRWVAGLYFLREDAERNESFIINFDPSQVSAFVVGLGGDVTFDQENTTESAAAFGQLTWDVTDTVALTIGGRYTRDSKSIIQSAFDNLQDDNFPGIPLGPFGTPYTAVSGSDTWSDFSPRFSIDWQLDDDILLYFTAAKGFKSGAFPSQANSAASATDTADPEEVTNFEIGAKTQWLDDRLRFNLSLFDTDYQDLQVFQLLSNTLVSANAEESSIRGIELDFLMAITEGLTVNGSYAVMDAEYDDYSFSFNGVLLDRSGNDMARAPEDSWTIGANYALQLGNNMSLDFNVDVAHNGEFFYEASNDPRSRQESYELVNASIKLSSGNENWDLTAWGKNLADEDYDVHRIVSSNGGAVAIPGTPRTFGVSVNYYWR